MDDAPRPSPFPLLLALPAVLLFYVAVARTAGTLFGITMLAQSLGQILGLGIPIAFGLLLLDGARGDAALRRPRPGVLTLTLLLAAALWVPLWALDALRARVIADPDQEAVFHMLIQADPLACLLGLAVLPALLEETAFRGILLGRLGRAWGPGVAIPATALLFAAFHLSPAQFIVPLALGLLYGWLRWRTASLWPCILAHAVHNGITLWAMRERPAWLGAEPAFPPLPWLATGLAVTAVTLWALSRRTRP